MEERSMVAYNNYLAASQKLDYFFTGVVAAITAYLGENYQPNQLTLSVKSLELVALFIFVATLFFSFKRLETSVTLFLKGHQVLDNYEKKGKLVVALRDGAIINEQTGKCYTTDEMKKEIVEHDGAIIVLENIIEKLKKKTSMYYVLRNYSFMIALLMTIISKIWSAY